MTTLLAPTTTFITPLSETLSRISTTLNNYLAAKSEKARLAEHIKQLAAMDPHMLNDIGLKNFNRMPMAQQQSALLEASKHAQDAPRY